MYYYPGHRIQTQFCTQSALSPLPGEHSGQSSFYRRAQCQLNHNTVRILPGPHLTPGSRAAMWIKCLAEGKITGRQWDSNPDSQRESRAVTPLYHGTSTKANRFFCNKIIIHYKVKQCISSCSQCVNHMIFPLHRLH